MLNNSVKVRVGRSGEGWIGEVEVEHRGEKTWHTVTLSRADVARWARGDRDEDVAELVRRSFDFLLEREPPTSILRRFDLSVIQRYFPEYDRLFKP